MQEETEKKIRNFTNSFASTGPVRWSIISKEQGRRHHHLLIKERTKNEERKPKKKEKKRKAAVRRSSNNTTAREEEEEEEESSNTRSKQSMQRHDNTIYALPKKPKKIHTAVDCDRLQRKSSKFFLLHRLRNAKDSRQDPSLVPSLSLSPPHSTANEDEEERRRKNKGSFELLR